MINLASPAAPPAKTFGRTVRAFDTIDSTNTAARACIQEGDAEGTIVTAEEQTAGKGRLGRSWQSAKGKNLTFSIILRPEFAPAQFGLLSLLAGTAVCETLREEYGLDASCKWPNDVLVGGKKLCGILSEALHQSGSSPAVIVGIGVNVNESTFPAEIAQSATSIAIATGAEHDRALLLSRLLGRMEYLYRTLSRGDSASIIARWTAHSSTIGREIRVTNAGALVAGTARGIAEDGGLILSTEGRMITVHAGDVTLREAS